MPRTDHSDYAVNLTLTGHSNSSNGTPWVDPFLWARKVLANITHWPSGIPWRVHRITSAGNSRNALLDQFGRLLVLNNLLTTYQQANAYIWDNDIDPFEVIRRDIPLQLFEKYRERVVVQKIYKNKDGKTLALELTLLDADGERKSKVFVVQELWKENSILRGNDKKPISSHRDIYSLISGILAQLDWINVSELDTLDRWAIFWVSQIDSESIWKMNVPDITNPLEKREAFRELVWTLEKNLNYYRRLSEWDNQSWKKAKITRTLQFIGALYLVILHTFLGLRWDWAMNLDIATLGKYFREMDAVQARIFDRWIWTFTQWVESIFSDSSAQERVSLQFNAFFDGMMKEFLSMIQKTPEWNFLSFTSGGLYDLFKELERFPPAISSYKLSRANTERQEAA